MSVKKVTLQQIADQLNITKVSVSKAINNQAGISDELRKKILEAAYDLGYFINRPNTTVKANKFAFIIQKRFFLENENFYTAIYYYLSKKCMANGKALSLFVINNIEDDEIQINQHISKNAFDGIFIGGEIKDIYYYMLSNLGIPSVSIDYCSPHVQSDCILTDNFNIGHLVATYLIDKGHRKIGFVGNVFSTSNVLDRFYGYRKALTTAKLEFREEWNINNYDPATGYHVLDIQLPAELPTAFICHCDMSAYFLVQKLNIMNIKVPDDVSVISFDNTSLAQTCTPSLTTVDIGKEDFAKHAYDILLSRIKHPDADSRRVYLNTRIIERESVKVLD